MKPQAYLLLTLVLTSLVTLSQPLAIAAGSGDWSERIPGSSNVGSRRLADREGEIFAIGPAADSDGNRVLCPAPDDSNPAAESEFCRGGIELAELSRVIDGQHFEDTAQSHSRVLLFNRELAPFETTVILGLQNKLTDLLAGRSGSIVVLEPDTGAVLALATTLADEDGLVSASPPGSIFKLVVYATGLEQGVIDAGTSFSDEVEYNGVPNFGRRVCGGDLRTVIALSCNTSVVRAAGLSAADNSNDLAEMAAKFGIDGTRRFALIEASTVGADFDRDLGATSIGQFNVRLNPMTAASLAATIANSGTRMTPSFVVDPDAPGTEAMSMQTAEILAQGMAGAVDVGTAAGAAPKLDAALKTGTAEDERSGFDDAWTIGFAPRHEPVVAVAVFLDGEGAGRSLAGGVDAAPLALSAMDLYLSTFLRGGQ